MPHRHPARADGFVDVPCRRSDIGHRALLGFADHVPVTARCTQALVVGPGDRVPLGYPASLFVPARGRSFRTRGRADIGDSGTTGPPGNERPTTLGRIPFRHRERPRHRDGLLLRVQRPVQREVVAGAGHRLRTGERLRADHRTALSRNRFRTGVVEHGKWCGRGEFGGSAVLGAGRCEQREAPAAITRAIRVCKFPPIRRRPMTWPINRRPGYSMPSGRLGPRAQPSTGLSSEPDRGSRGSARRSRVRASPARSDLRRAGAVRHRAGRADTRGRHRRRRSRRGNPRR